MGSNPSSSIMTTILDRLKVQILFDKKNSLYDIWKGCYETDEYDFMARIELIKEFPEVSWTNPEHENMLVNMAFDSHVPNWDNKFLEGGWTKNGICTDRLKDLYMYYNMWLDIINSCKEIHDQ